MVTGVCGDLGAAFARCVAADPGVDRVVGVDGQAPREDLPGVTFVRLDTRRPVIEDVLAAQGVDTVVHLGVAALPAPGAGRSSLKESNVIGTMRLLAACQRAAGIRKLVLKSSTSVYGSSPRDPARFTEDMSPRRSLRSGFAKDSADAEGYVRGFSRRRPDVLVTTLRLASLLSARVDTAMSRYFALPVLPTILGFDPRLQLLHCDDAQAVLHRATVHDRPGTFNVAGTGVLLLSQAMRRTGLPTVAVPSFAFPGVARTLGRAVGSDIGSDLVDLLAYGRGVDTTALHSGFGYQPSWSTAATLDAFVAARGPGPLSADRLRSVEERLGALLAGGGRG
jgi:UDP-glucose 4-epimerase